MFTKLAQFWKDEEAPTAVEYGIMVAGIAVVVMTAVWALGGSVSTLFTNVSGRVAGGGQ